jgi:LPS-assembly lipoprotein
MMRASTLSLSIVLCTLTAFLSACGFEPLYGTTAVGSNVAGQLSAIEIEEQDNRLGQLIRNDLLSSFASGEPAASRYRLQFTAVAGSQTLIENDNEDTRRFSYRVNVNYRLIDEQTGNELKAGKTFSQVSYDRTTSDFANVQAETNAMERAAKEIGNDIRTRLAAYFSSI